SKLRQLDERTDLVMGPVFHALLRALDAGYRRQMATRRPCEVHVRLAVLGDRDEIAGIDTCDLCQLSNDAVRREIELVHDLSIAPFNCFLDVSALQKLAGNRPGRLDAVASDNRRLSSIVGLDIALDEALFTRIIYGCSGFSNRTTSIQTIIDG